ncbi:MAG: hypothetical protein ABWY33_08335 [Cellulomonas sp.]
MTDQRYVPFGSAPRPTTDAEIEARVRELLARLAQRRARGLEKIVVTAHLDGADIASLKVDGTGVAVEVDGPAPERLAAVDVTHREPAVVRSLELVAHPASVAGVPVDVAIAASDLRFAWATSSENRLFLEVQPPSQDEPVVGTARVSAPRKGIDGAARAALADALRSRGFTLTDLDLDLESRGPRELSVRAEARVRKSVVRAAVVVTGVASIDDALVLSVRDAEISSTNPIVGALVAPFRPRIAAVVARTIDLAALLPAGVSVSDVSVVVGPDDVVVSATLG